MERILSKEEIAELLSAVKSGELPPETWDDEAPDVERRTKKLDLVRGHWTGRWRLQNFDIILDSFARDYGIALTNLLQRTVTVNRTTIETDDFETVLHKISEHGTIGLIDLTPLKHGGLFLLDTSLSFTLIEIIMGGANEGNPMLLERPLTPIEMNILKVIMGHGCKNLQEALAPVEQIEASVVRIEVNPRLVNIVPPETEVMVAKFVISLDNISGTMTLVIPSTSLEPLREKIKDSIMAMAGSKESAWSGHLSENLGHMQTVLMAQSGTVSLSIRDILDLRAGDFIDLEYDPNTPIRILVEQRPKFFGIAGIRKGKKAVRVTSKIRSD